MEQKERKEWQHWKGWRIISIFLFLLFFIFVMVGAEYYMEKYKIDRAFIMTKINK